MPTNLQTSEGKSVLIEHNTTSTNGSSIHNNANNSELLSIIKPKLIIVIRNGTKPRKFIRMLLNKKTVHSFDQVLNNITQAIKLHSGPVKKLFSLSGKRVNLIQLWIDRNRLYEQLFFLFMTLLLTSLLPSPPGDFTARLLWRRSHFHCLRSGKASPGRFQSRLRRWFHLFCLLVFWMVCAPDLGNRILEWLISLFLPLKALFLPDCTPFTTVTLGFSCLFDSLERKIIQL